VYQGDRYGASSGDNTIAVTQDGDDGVVFMEQVGYRNSSTVTQTAGGSGSSANVYQTGDDLISAVTQSGDFQTALVTQTGMMNESVITQDGSNNSATVTQGGMGELFFDHAKRHWQFDHGHTKPAGPLTVPGRVDRVGRVG